MPPKCFTCTPTLEVAVGGVCARSRSLQFDEHVLAVFNGGVETPQIVQKLCAVAAICGFPPAGA